MNTLIFVPKKIKVGYQDRNDTYTKKLAYVIYQDEKNKWRKEPSWNSWRDQKIDPEEFDNNPTSGFVLNKKVGDYSSGWNHRKSYTRVYDPRNFEFEITIENLLYILENCNSIKGKGLEGEFVYGWSGKDLILVPVDSPDYKGISEYNKIVHNKQTVKSKDLILGATYKTKKNESLIYLGRFNCYSWVGENCGLEYFFAVERNYGKKTYYFETKKNLSGLVACENETPSESYPEIMEQLERSKTYSPVDKEKSFYTDYPFEEFVKKGDKLFYTENIAEGQFVDCRLSIYDDYYYFSANYWKPRQYNSYVHFDHRETTVEEIYNILKPKILHEILKNGKEYKRGN